MAGSRNLAGNKTLISSVQTNFGRVVFADLHNGQIVVITAMNADQPDATTGATFMALTAAQGTTFPAHGTDLGDWKLFESKRQVPALLSFAVQGDARSDLLVLAAPGVPSVDVSTMVVPTPTGALERQWQTLPLTDGVAWSKTGTTGGQTVRLRAGTAYDGPVTIRGERTSFVTAICMGCAGGEQDAKSFREQVASVYGYDLDTLQGQVVYDEKVPLERFVKQSSGTRLTVVDVTEPGGQHFRGYVTREEAKEPGTGGMSGATLYPLSRKWNDNTPLILQGKGNSVVVVAPGASKIRWETPDAEGTEAVNATGYAEFASPATGFAELRVLSYDASGNTVGEYVQSVDGPVVADPLDLEP